MIRIGIVIEDLDKGGAPASYAHGLLRKLTGHSRVQPILCYCRGDADDVPDGVEVVSCPDRAYPTRILPDRSRLPRLSRVEREHGIDLFHLNRIPDLGHWQAHRAEAPVVATVHGTLHWEDVPVQSLPTGYRYRRRFFDRLGGYTLDRAFAVSEYVAELLKERAGYPESRVACTYEAIDNAFFDLPPREPPDYAPDEYLLHVSNQAAKKNLETVIRALSQFERDIDLIVTGRGWEATCGPLVSRLGLEERVEFRGFVPQSELVALYDNTACFVFPSYHETFGLPNVEAMARGAPVVTSDAFAIPEVVGEGGHFVHRDAIGDPERLAREITKLLYNQEYRNQLRAAATEQANRFSWNRHLEDVIQNYESLLGEAA
jgi:glycosyltransferase involved in cell wall biosynthesis